MAANKIKWSAATLEQFASAIDYIEDSLQNAEMVESKILTKIE